MTTLQEILSSNWDSEGVKVASEAPQFGEENVASEQDILKIATDLGIFGDMFPEDVGLGETKTAEEIKLAAYQDAVGQRSFDYFDMQLEKRMVKIAGEILAAADMEAAQGNLVGARPPVAVSTNQDPVGDKAPPSLPGMTPYSIAAGAEAGAEGLAGHMEQRKIASAALQKHLLLRQLQE